jgi:hypothetical protein
MPLKVSDGMGAWIDDFKKSDAPQFKGKSTKERRDQAIAAYMSAKRDQKEATGEQPPFEGPYLKKKVATPGKQGYGPSAAKHLAKIGLKKQLDKKPVKESTAAYAASLEKEKEKRLTTNDQDKLARLRRMMDREKTKVTREPKGEYDRKVTGYLKKKYNEDVELGEETTFEVEVEGLPTMYVKAKSPGEVKANLRKIVKQPSMITGVSRVTDAEMKKVFRDKAQGREKDDDDLDESMSNDDKSSIALKALVAKKNLKQADNKVKSVDFLKKMKARVKAGEDLKKEEVELDEAVKKDEREYGYEGDMAISQLKTIMRHAEHMMGMLKEDTDLPEWVQSKITLATDYMQTAHDYMMSEMTEGTQQVDELSQNTLRQYHGKSALDIRKKRDQLNKGTLSTADHKKAQRRVTGINRAANKMEEVEEGMKPDRKAPGWMLRADPKLKAKVDANKAKNKEFKKLVGTKKEQASMCEQCGKVHEGNCSS